MQERFLQAITVVDSLMWGPWTMVFIAVVSVFLTVRSGFFEVSHFGYIFRSSFGRAFSYLRWIYFMPGIVFAGVTRTDELWAVANTSVFLSAVPNLIALVMLSGVFLTLMRDFLSGDRQYATAIIDSNREWVRSADRLDIAKGAT